MTPNENGKGREGVDGVFFGAEASSCYDHVLSQGRSGEGVEGISLEQGSFHVTAICFLFLKGVPMEEDVRVKAFR